MKTYNAALCWILLLFVSLQGAFANLIINEFSADPVSDFNNNTITNESNDEFVEIFNNGTSPANTDDLTLVLNDSSIEEVNLSGSINGNTFFVLLNPIGTLNFDGQLLILNRTSGLVLDKVSYGTHSDGNTSDNAPRGNTSTANDECIARVPNGKDTNADNSDFVKQQCTFASTNLDFIPPVAVASDVSGAEDSIITFNASQSTDNVGIASYSWDFDSSNGIGVDASGVVVTNIYPLNGSFNVTLVVTDAQGNSNIDASVATVSFVNDAPQINGTVPNVTFSEDSTVAVFLNGFEKDEEDRGQGLNWTLTDVDTTLLGVNSQNKDLDLFILQGLPDSFGQDNITLTLSDTGGRSATQTITVTIVNINDAPTITSSAITAATQGSLYNYTVSAQDPDNTSFLFSFNSSPAGMSINSSGTITWTPLANQTGANSVIVGVSDGVGGVAYQSFTITVANINDVPTITSSAVITATEGTLYNYLVTASDIDGDTLTFRLNTAPSGMAINSTSGLISWTPSNSQVGSANRVLINVTDPSNASATQDFNITVSNINSVPEFSTTPPSTAIAGFSYTYDANASDPDVTGDSVIFFLPIRPSGMTIDNTTGIISWSPVLSQVGSNAVTMTAYDNNSAQANQSFTITVSNNNTKPVISSFQPDVSSILITKTQKVEFSANATDANNDALTFFWFENGTQVATGQFFNYSKANIIDRSNFTIELQVMDRIENTSRSVRVEVTPGPTADKYDGETTNFSAMPDLSSATNFTIENRSAGVKMHFASGLDIRNISEFEKVLVLTHKLVGVNTTAAPTLANAQANITMQNQSFGTSPLVVTNASFGTDVSALSFRVCDFCRIIAFSGTSNITFQVDHFSVFAVQSNQNPTFTSTPTTNATEDRSYNYSAESTDPEGQNITFSLNVSPSGMTINSSGFLTWTPNDSHIGNNTVVIAAQDTSAGRANQTFSVFVANINDAPVFTVTPKTNAVQGQFFNDTLTVFDPDPNEVLMYQLLVAPQGLSLNPSNGILQWVPTSSQVGNNSVAVMVSDSANANATLNYSILVANVNDAPSTPALTSPANNSVQTNPSRQVSLSWNASSDADGDTIMYFVLLDNSSNLSSPLPTNTTTTQTSIALLPLADSQTYRWVIVASDGVANSSASETRFFVTDFDHAPSITLIDPNQASFSLIEGNFSLVTINVTDTDSNTLTLRWTRDGQSVLNTTLQNTAVPQTTSFNFSAGFLDAGIHTLQANVSDTTGNNASAAYTITVTDTNRQPTLIAPGSQNATEEVRFTLQLSASDLDTDNALTFTENVTDANLTLNNSGFLEWTPTNANVGVASVFVTACDNTTAQNRCANQTVSITVANVNDAPNITSTAPNAGTEGQQYSYQLIASDVDVGDSLTFALTTAPQGMSINTTSGLILWTPTFAQVGNNQVTATATDRAGAQAGQSFTITVSQAQNSQPQFTTSPPQSAREGVAYSYDVNATDANNDSITFSLTTAPAGMSINSGSGLIQWTPTSSQVGNNQVTVRVDDARGSFNTQSFIVSVSSATNTIPSFTSSPVLNAVANQQYSYDANAQDSDNETLTFRLDIAPSGMSINAQSGLITWTPTINQVGSHTVQVRVDDTRGGFATQNYNVNVVASGSAVAGVSITGTAFGSETQKRSNPRARADIQNVFADAVATITNNGNQTITNIRFANATLAAKFNFSIISISKTTLAVGEQATITMRARVPEDLDSVDSLFRPAPIFIGQTFFSFDGTNQGGGGTLISNAQMQAQNHLDFSDMDISFDGETDSISTTRDGDRVDEIKPGDVIELDIEVENNFPDSENLEIENVEVRVEIDDNDFDVDEEEDIGDIAEGEEDDVQFGFDVEEDVDDGDYDLVITLTGRDENGALHGRRLVIKLEVERERHEVLIQALALSPGSTIDCDRRSVELSASILNIGRSDERRIRVVTQNQALNIDVERSNIELDEDDSATERLTLLIPSRANEGSYPITTNVYYDDTRLSDSESITLTLDCSQEETPVSRPREREPVEEEQEQEGEEGTEEVVVVPRGAPANQQGLQLSGQRYIPTLPTAYLNFGDSSSTDLVLIIVAILLAGGIIFVAGAIGIALTRK